MSGQSDFTKTPLAMSPLTSALPLSKPHSSSSGFGGMSKTVSSSMDDADVLDQTGKNWMAITDVQMLKCSNLDGLIKKSGDVVEEEKALWAQLGCGEKLKDLYYMWEKHSHATKDMCESLRESAGIVVGVDWGFASQSGKRRWNDLMCDCHYTEGWSDSCLHGKPPTVHATTTAAGIQKAVTAREPREKLGEAARASPSLASRWGLRLPGMAWEVSPNKGNALPVIAIVLGSTSRGFRWSRLDEAPLVKILLSSMERTLEAGFEYRVYVGFDAGDLFFDDDARRAELAAWVSANLEGKAATRGIDLKLVTVRFLNVLRKPGPIFNFLTAAAFADGADFVYRINDDTEFRTPFASALTNALKGFQPPYLGVVGPTCADGNKKILTHDFVHRTHYHIFQTYYPIQLTDWWMDDWISKVYPRGNFGRHGNVAVSHHTWMTGSGNPVRYEVDYAHKKYLNTELMRGARLIGEFMLAHCRGTCNMPDGQVSPEWQGVYDPRNQTVFASVMEEQFKKEEDEFGYGDDEDYAGDSSVTADEDYAGVKSATPTKPALYSPAASHTPTMSGGVGGGKEGGYGIKIGAGGGRDEVTIDEEESGTINGKVGDGIGGPAETLGRGPDGGRGGSGADGPVGGSESGAGGGRDESQDPRKGKSSSSIRESSKSSSKKSGTEKGLVGADSGGGGGGLSGEEGRERQGAVKQNERDMRQTEGKISELKARVMTLDGVVASKMHNVYLPRGRAAEEGSAVSQPKTEAPAKAPSLGAESSGGTKGLGGKEQAILDLKGLQGEDRSLDDVIANLERLRAELSLRLDNVCVCVRARVRLCPCMRVCVEQLRIYASTPAPARTRAALTHTLSLSASPSLLPFLLPLPLSSSPSLFLFLSPPPPHPTSPPLPPPLPLSHSLSL
jgi:hypothetical protein